MKKLISQLMLISLLLIVATSNNQVQAQSNTLNLNNSEIKGTWQNQLGSTLHIESIDSNGQLSGFYISPSGTSGEKYPLVGWVNFKNGTSDQHVSTVVSFTVRWGAYGSITSWTGYFVKEKDGSIVFKTQWHLVRPVADQEWSHILTNQDQFKKNR